MVPMSWWLLQWVIRANCIGEGIAMNIILCGGCTLERFQGQVKRYTIGTISNERTNLRIW